MAVGASKPRLTISLSSVSPNPASVKERMGRGTSRPVACVWIGDAGGVEGEVVGCFKGARGWKDERMKTTDDDE